MFNNAATIAGALCGQPVARVRESRNSRTVVMACCRSFNLLRMNKKIRYEKRCVRVYIYRDACMHACMHYTRTIPAYVCYAMLCYAMLCYAMLCYASVVSCYVMLCYLLYCVVLCYVMLCYVMLCYVMFCYVVLLESILERTECNVTERNVT